MLVRGKNSSAGITMIDVVFKLSLSFKVTVALVIFLFASRRIEFQKSVSFSLQWKYVIRYSPVVKLDENNILTFTLHKCSQITLGGETPRDVFSGHVQTN